MTSTVRSRRLDRAVKLSRLLYRRETAELARMSLASMEKAQSAEAAQSLLDGDPPVADFLSELAIARAARARRELNAAEARLQAQLQLAIDVMTKLRGAETLLDTETTQAERVAAGRALDEVIELAVCQVQPEASDTP